MFSICLRIRKGQSSSCYLANGPARICLKLIVQYFSKKSITYENKKDTHVKEITPYIEFPLLWVCHCRIECYTQYGHDSRFTIQYQNTFKFAYQRKLLSLWTCLLVENEYVFNNNRGVFYYYYFDKLRINTRFLCYFYGLKISLLLSRNIQFMSALLVFHYFIG